MTINPNTQGDGGWLTNDIPLLTLNTGIECVSVDTQLPNGQQPQTTAMNLQQIALAGLFLNAAKDKTPVSGTIQYTQVNAGRGATVTGVSILMGGAGGTDNVIVGLYNSAGVLVASSALAGTLAGAASAWQQVPFTAQYKIVASIYYVALQTNGTTAHPATYNAPAFPLATGSQTGAFGTMAAITPPTTYTANVGPIAQLY